MKGCIYYTDNTHDPEIVSACQKQLRSAFDGEIVCVSLKPTDFGDVRFVLEGRTRSYPTMTEQILTALELSNADHVFFTEDDVLYHPSHFNITPEDNYKYYYNINNWRWRWTTDVAITYDELHSLSGMCCYRETAINHYNYRMKVIGDQGLDKDRSREPRWARRFGYEPGTKPTRRGGITDEEFVSWKSEYPNIDIRHNGTFSHPKTFLNEFIHLPTSWKETNVYTIPGWNLKELFK